MGDINLNERALSIEYNEDECNELRVLQHLAKKYVENNVEDSDISEILTNAIDDKYWAIVKKLGEVNRGDLRSLVIEIVETDAIEKDDLIRKVLQNRLDSLKEKDSEEE